LHFDSSTRTGNVFHLMGALSEFGKLGVTSIGNSRAEAQDIYKRVEEVLDRETQIVYNQDPNFKSPSLPINWV
nr:peptide ligase PGM1-related protein [Xenococcaceae cyanobacterium MO_167.B52]